MIFTEKEKHAPIQGNEWDDFTYNYPIEEIFEKKEELNYLKQSLKSLNKEELEIVNSKVFFRNEIQ